MIAWFVASHLISRSVGGGLMKLFLGNLMGDLKKLWGWLCHRSFWQLAFMGLAIFAVIQRFELAHARAEAAKWHNQFTTEHSGRLVDRKSYVDAQAAAAVQNKAHVAKVEQQYQRNSDNEKHSYLDDLARLRRMRGGQNSTSQSVANGAGPSAPHGPATGADANGLPVSPSDDVQAASEIELRLMHLQNWIEKQISVDPNAP